MSFASAAFLLLFLPLALGVFHALRGTNAAMWRTRWLLLASLVFFAWAGLRELLVLLVSVAFNYSAGRYLLERSRDHASRWPLSIAIGANVALLLACKVLSANSAGGSAYLSTSAILIPLGLSFITFQQIAFLLDCHRRRMHVVSLTHYSLFIAFFPQLVMGPIVHFRQLVPQFEAGRLADRSMQNVLVGLSIFAVGLFKKLVIADTLATPVDRIFAAADSGMPLNTVDAWAGAIGFQLQLYMDFTGYADMAIGLARMFNVNLPINYDRPYHAVNRFDLWRRWHLTFVEFMRTHVFQPLVRLRGMPMWLALTITGLLSGVWHGLGWTFVLWGLVQTALLLLSHVWTHWRRGRVGGQLPRVLVVQIVITFAVSAAVGVMFRAPSVNAALQIYSALLPLEGIPLPAILAVALRTMGFDPSAPGVDLLLTVNDVGPFMLGVAGVWILPQTRELFARYWTALDPRAPRQVPPVPRPSMLQFELSARWGLVIALLLATSLAAMDAGRRFVYFQF